jgi:hypothetical protein
MKEYIAPKILLIDLRAEESIAYTNVQKCNGACKHDVDYNHDGKIDYYAHGS